MKVEKEKSRVFEAQGCDGGELVPACCLWSRRRNRPNPWCELRSPCSWGRRGPESLRVRIPKSLREKERGTLDTLSAWPLAPMRTPHARALPLTCLVRTRDLRVAFC